MSTDQIRLNLGWDGTRPDVQFDVSTRALMLGVRDKCQATSKQFFWVSASTVCPKGNHSPATCARLRQETMLQPQSTSRHALFPLEFARRRAVGHTCCGM